MQLKRFPVRSGGGGWFVAAGGGPTKGSGSLSHPVVHSALLRGAGQRQSPTALEAFSGGGGPMLRAGSVQPRRLAVWKNSEKWEEKKMRQLSRD